MEEVTYKTSRYTAKEYEIYSFIKSPRFLDDYEELYNLSCEAKWLYIHLLDRHSVSVKNGWVNEKGEIYIIYPRKEMEFIIHCGHTKLDKVIKELKAYNLFEEEVQGFNKPNLIYLTYVDTDKFNKISYKNSKETTQNKGLPQYGSWGFRNTEVEASVTRKLGVPQCGNWEFREQNANYNNLNNNNLNYNNSIYPSIPVENTMEDNIHNTTKQNDRMIDINAEIEKIRNQIDYSQFINRHLIRNENFPNEYDVFYMQSFIDPIVNIMLEVKMSKGTYKIQGANVPSQVVQQVFEKLTFNDIELVITKIKNSEEPITNMKAYLISSLYSQVLSMGFKEAIGQEKV